PITAKSTRAKLPKRMPLKSFCLRLFRRSTSDLSPPGACSSFPTRLPCVLPTVPSFFAGSSDPLFLERAEEGAADLLVADALPLSLGLLTRAIHHFNRRYN